MMTMDPAVPPRAARSLIIALAACVLGAVSCDAGEEAPVDTTVPTGTPVEIEAPPLVAVGVAQGDSLQELGRVVTPFVLPDGRLVVPDGIAQVIRTFDLEGAHLASLGGRGEGPGEFTAVTSAWNRGDTIEVADGRLRRVTRFGPNGTVEVISLEREAPVQTMPHGALQDGWVTAAVTGFRMNARDEITLHGFSRDGAHLGDLARTQGILRIEVPGASGVHPLSPRAVVRIAENRIYVGETESPHIRVFDLHGTVEREITWGATEAPAPEDAMEAVREAPDPLPSFEPLFEDAPVPDRLSVFWDFLVDELGFIWVRPYDPERHAAALGGLGSGDYLTSPGGGGGGRWLVLSPDGEVAGTVEVPAGFRPTQATAAHLIGIHVDALGVESVQVYLLSRT